jgi:hypothetical protein
MLRYSSAAFVWVAMALMSTSFCLAATPTTDFGTLTLVAQGYVWIENIFFDGRGAMFFSDSFRGEAVRVTPSSANETEYETSVWLSGFHRILGFALTQDNSEMYAVAWLSPSDFKIIAFNLSVPETWRVVSTTELSGNGLGLDVATNTLYTASEGDFIPGQGVVYSMNMSVVVGNSTAHEATPLLFDHGLTAADGLWIDHATRIMYVSEVLNATVRRYDLTNASPQGGRAAMINQFTAPGMAMLDDFSVTSDYCVTATTTMFGADFWAGSVFAFPADGSSSNSTELVRGLFNPTSVRPGGVGFSGDDRTLFISEGGGIDKDMANRRLWKLTLDSRFAC